MPRWRRVVWSGALCAHLLAACGGGDHGAQSPQGAAPTQGGAELQGTPGCPARAEAPEPLPDTPRELSTAEYWLARYGDEANRPLLSAEQVRAHNAALRFDSNGLPRIVDLHTQATSEVVRTTLEERLDFLQERVASGAYLAEDDVAPRFAVSRVDTFRPQVSMHVALADVPLRCGPYLGRLSVSEGDARLDRNNCSTARPGELIEVLGRLGDVRFVRTPFSVGFVGEDAALSVALSASESSLWLDAARARLEAALTVGEGDAAVHYAEGSVLPARGADQVRVATRSGFSDAPARVTLLAPPVTRAAIVKEAFRYLGAPYGWGGQGGGRDCSRLLLDVFRGIGLEMPRASVPQSQAGTYSVEVPAEATETDRLSLIDVAQERGVVLMHFPGHIMLYLGRDAQGVPRALHAFADYLAPCDGGGETSLEVGRVAVSALSLGAGTSRRSFLERLTRLTVLGAPPGYALLAFAKFRDSAPPPEVPVKCDDDLDVAMFRSPRKPVVGETTRAIVVSTRETRPAKLFLIDPGGERIVPAVQELGVGPYARVAEWTPGRHGRWTMLLADGPRVLGCERFGVANARGQTEPSRSDEDPAWHARFRWERDTEAFYAAFVEQLFSHPVDDPVAWPSLTALLRDPSRNLLYNHLGLDEDERLELSPDCADLPYFLRAYFAWKANLPFGFRHCSRGRAGVPPQCGDVISNEIATPGADAVAAFSHYVLRAVRPGVHSASNRTLPNDPASDMYPLPLTREALKPGVVFNDPYGHLIVVAKWVPQGLAGDGMLLGADAQPDATVGRRRFWRGSFLFTPSTDDVGAGFKAFRPLWRESPDAPLSAFDREQLKASEHHPDASLQQYKGTAQEFYARMDALIYPRPLQPEHRIRMLVQALEEQVVRRVSSVDTGEEWARTHGGPMPMPDGYALFETQGPWEDFATPSRDMRLLIAIDTVLGLEELVRETPERFGFASGSGEQAAASVHEQLRRELAARSFSYTGSDGARVTRSLTHIVDQRKALEMAYNPNDCVEVRWGEPAGSDAMAACKRHAPAAQREKMQRYRSWFSTRTRPARP